MAASYRAGGTRLEAEMRTRLLGRQCWLAVMESLTPGAVGRQNQQVRLVLLQRDPSPGGDCPSEDPEIAFVLYSGYGSVAAIAETAEMVDVE